jgi:hypothetical protein
MSHTRGFVLTFSISFALSKVRLRTLRGKLFSEEDRRAIADDVVRQLKQYGDPWGLYESMPNIGPGPAMER